MTTDAPGTRVLVVEDEWLIADQIEQCLLDLGYGVVGPAASVDEALALIAGARVDVAVLDVRLDETTTFPIARVLALRHIPFMFVTGFVNADLPEEFADRVMMNKPIRMERLGLVLRQLLARPEVTQDAGGSGVAPVRRAD